MIFRNLPLSALLFLLSFTFYVSHAQDTLYTQYDAATFFELEVVQQKINLDNIDYHLLNAAVFHETNRQRQKRSLNKLEFSPSLRKAAMIHSRQMVQHDFLGHNNSYNDALRSVPDRMEKVGWPTQRYGENVADAFLIDYDAGTKLKMKQEEGRTVFYKSVFFGLSTKEVPRHTYQSFAEALVDFWMGSKPHRENILRESFTHLGCGISSVEYSSDTRKIPKTKATQNFGGK